jgi:hypothetical protein
VHIIWGATSQPTINTWPSDTHPEGGMKGKMETPENN